MEKIISGDVNRKSQRKCVQALLHLQDCVDEAEKCSRREVLDALQWAERQLAIDINIAYGVAMIQQLPDNSQN